MSTRDDQTARLCSARQPEPGDRLRRYCHADLSELARDYRVVCRTGRPVKNFILGRHANDQTELPSLVWLNARPYATNPTGQGPQ